MFLISAGIPCAGWGQNVFIVVMDGARYSETFGHGAANIPHIWNELRPQGTICTNFRNEGFTKTCPGHATLETGTWQTIQNNGSERPTAPTLFEYYRQETGKPQSACYVVAGKTKLDVLTNSNSEGFGAQYAASYREGFENDVQTWEVLASAMRLYHPSLVMVNFPAIDIAAHSGSWSGYTGAIRTADSLVGLLWRAIQSDPVYRNTTTLFVANDHGRHDEDHGGFTGHGDSCEGCRHIMLLALGPQFAPGEVRSDPAEQIDVAPTAAELLHLSCPSMHGKSLLRRSDQPHVPTQ